MFVSRLKSTAPPPLASAGFDREFLPLMMMMPPDGHHRCRCLAIVVPAYPVNVICIALNCVGCARARAMLTSALIVLNVTSIRRRRRCNDIDPPRPLLRRRRRRRRCGRHLTTAAATTTDNGDKQKNKRHRRNQQKTAFLVGARVRLNLFGNRSINLRCICVRFLRRFLCVCVCVAVSTTIARPA